jgi:hypothetical protein
MVTKDQTAEIRLQMVLMAATKVVPNTAVKWEGSKESVTADTNMDTKQVTASSRRRSKRKKKQPMLRIARMKVKWSFLCLNLMI